MTDPRTHETNPQGPNEPTHSGLSRRIWRRLAVVATLALGTGALLAAGTALGFPGHGSHGRGCHGGGFSALEPEAIAERAAFMAHRLGREVDATPEQQAAVEELLVSGFSDLADLHTSRGELHAQVMAQLTAPEIDREALETLRAEKIAAMDDMTRGLLTLAADVAEVFSPEQRAQLADFASRFHRFGRGSD